MEGQYGTNRNLFHRVRRQNGKKETSIEAKCYFIDMVMENTEVHSHG